MAWFVFSCLVGAANLVILYHREGNGLNAAAVICCFVSALFALSHAVSI